MYNGTKGKEVGPNATSIRVEKQKYKRLGSETPSAQTKNIEPPNSKYVES